VSLLEVSHVRKCFGETVAVDDLSFQIETGEVFGLLGPNGAGKTTTMSMIAGLLKPDSGSVQINGTPLTANDRSLRVQLGIVPQDLAIYPQLTADENLNFFGQIYGLRGGQLRERIKVVLEATGLESSAHKLAEVFSGGMQRRLNFAIALLHEPALLILDEPTVGVDPQSRAHLLECIRELRDKGVGIVYASHYMEEVEAICSRVAIIDHGKMIACGALHDLLKTVQRDIYLRVSRISPALVDRIETMPQVEAALSQDSVPYKPDNGDQLLLVKGRTDSSIRLNDDLRQILEVLDECNVELCSIETNESNLERLFLEMTGHALRD